MTAEAIRASFEAAEPVTAAVALAAKNGKAMSPGGGGRPIIQVRAGDLHVLATEAEEALLNARAPFFIRGGIVRPVVDEVAASRGQSAKVARLVSVDRDTIIDHLSRSADWIKWNVRKDGWVPTDPPAAVASTIMARDGEWGFLPLVGVITTPTLRPDGTILASPGYDPATRLLLLDPPKLPPIPSKPTRADALNALALLNGLLDEFPFVDEASRSAALSGLITPVVRGAMPVAPMHATTAPVPGSGKSYVIDLCSAIATGERAPVISAGRTEEETEKRLGAALLAGQAIISIDNVNGELGGDALCQLIERPIVSVRPLGVSHLVKIESRATCFATGNNIQLVGDMTRRVVLCSLDPNVERPELRAFKARPMDAVTADRGRYVAAALIIARAYAVAGYPGELRPLASFEDWSRVVRSALVWLGRADPIDTMVKARAEDPVTTALGGLLETWHDAAGGSSRTAGAMVELAQTRDPLGNLVYSALLEALREVADDRRGGIDTRRLGKFLGRYNGRVVDGLKIAASDDTHAKQRTWKVVRL